MNTFVIICPFVLSEDGQIEVSEFRTGVPKLQSLSLLDRCTRERITISIKIGAARMCLEFLFLRRRKLSFKIWSEFIADSASFIKILALSSLHKQDMVSFHFTFSYHASEGAISIDYPCLCSTLMLQQEELWMVKEQEKTILFSRFSLNTHFLTYGTWMDGWTN